MNLAHIDRKKLISQLLDLIDEVQIILKYESDPNFIFINSL